MTGKQRLKNDLEKEVGRPLNQTELYYLGKAYFYDSLHAQPYFEALYKSIETEREYRRQKILRRVFSMCQEVRE